MSMDWQPFPLPTPEDGAPDYTTGLGATRGRLDSLFPCDPEMGVVTPEVLEFYLAAMMEMVSRANQPLSLAYISVDDSPLMRFFGTEGASMIGRAIARCLRQETRPHDVVGRTQETDANGIPNFIVVCPLSDEGRAGQMAQRLIRAMTEISGPAQTPWLSFSVGIAAMSIDISSPAEMCARAEAALQRARRAGGNSIWRHTDTLRSLAEQDQQNEDEN